MSSLPALAFLTLAFAAPPQSDTGVAHPALRVAVDGSKNPEKIPELTAQRHFILQIAEHAQPSRSELDRRRATMHLIGLGPSDQAAFVACTSGVRDRIDALNWTDMGGFTGGSVRDEQYKQILDTTWQQVVDVLSPEGRSKLNVYVETNVKRSIVIYGGPR